MTDLQFEILDELYFVISFEELQSLTGLEDITLYEQVLIMFKEGWVKCFMDEEELEYHEVDQQQSAFMNYNFLASKKGLFAHNSR